MSELNIYSNGINRPLSVVLSQDGNFSSKDALALCQVSKTCKEVFADLLL